MGNSGRRYIDAEKCNACNGRFLCVNDCVTSYIEERQVNGKAVAAFKERGACINCGHCNALCPNDAVVCETDFSEKNDFLCFLASKRTTRNYNKEKEITKEELNQIICAAQSAPSERNRATVRICMVKKKLKEVYLEALNVLKEYVDSVGDRHPQYKYISELYEKKTPIFWGAEYAVLIVGKSKYVVDATLVAERMQLMAYSLGIASGYNENLEYAKNTSDKLKEMLEIKNEESVLVSFALGYSELEYRKPYVGINRKVTYL
jgi:nitroreductase